MDYQLGGCASRQFLAHWERLIRFATLRWGAGCEASGAQVVLLWQLPFALREVHAETGSASAVRGTPRETPSASWRCLPGMD